MKKKIYIVIPAFNEGPVLEGVIKEIKAEGYENIIIIDDGSTDSTYDIAKKNNTAVLRHLINRGKGAAIKTGFEAAKLLQADHIITLDADGQHNPKDIHKLITYLENGYDVVLGTRNLKTSDMPFIKIIYNHLANILTWILYGFYVRDSQSGFRAYSKRALNLINTKNDRYEYDSEIIREIMRHKLLYKEVPITIRYTKYSMSKVHKQSFINGIKTIYRMAVS